MPHNFQSSTNFSAFVVSLRFGIEYAKPNNVQLTTEDIMVQEKKKGMEDTSEKKGRSPGREEEERSSSKSTGKTPATPNKTDSSSSRKSR